MPFARERALQFDLIMESWLDQLGSQWCPTLSAERRIPSYHAAVSARAHLDPFYLRSGHSDLSGVELATSAALLDEPFTETQLVSAIKMAEASLQPPSADEREASTDPQRSDIPELSSSEIFASPVESSARSGHKKSSPASRTSYPSRQSSGAASTPSARRLNALCSSRLNAHCLVESCSSRSVGRSASISTIARPASFACASCVRYP